MMSDPSIGPVVRSAERIDNSSKSGIIQLHKCQDGSFKHGEYKENGLKGFCSFCFQQQVFYDTYYFCVRNVNILFKP